MAWLIFDDGLGFLKKRIVDGMDLLFKNYPYFTQIYFNFSIFQYIGVLVINVTLLVSYCFAIEKKSLNLKQLIRILAYSLYFSDVIGITLLNHNRENVRQLVLNPLIEFQSIKPGMSIHLLRGMISNIIMFIPFGVFCMTRMKNCRYRIRRTIIFSGMCSLGIEIAQYVFCRGVSESLDVICNVVGAVCGAMATQMIIFCIKRIKKYG